MLPGTYPSFIYLFSPLIPLKTNQVGLVRGLFFPFGFGVLSCFEYQVSGMVL